MSNIQCFNPRVCVNTKYDKTQAWTRIGRRRDLADSQAGVVFPGSGGETELIHTLPTSHVHCTGPACLQRDTTSMHAADLIVVQAIHVWERFGGLSNCKCAAEKSSSGGISGAIVELFWELKAGWIFWWRPSMRGGSKG